MCVGHHDIPPASFSDDFRWSQFDAESLLSRRGFLTTVAGVSGLAVAAAAGCTSRGASDNDATAGVRSAASAGQSAGTVTLRAVDAVEVALVMDGSIDYLLAGTDGVKRHPLAYDFADKPHLIAEHGFSALVTVESDGRRSSVLYDGGLTSTGLARNLDVMAVNTTELRAIAISHGHFDHYAGLQGLFERVGRQKMPLVIHPDAWADRKIIFPTGAEVHLPPPKKPDLGREGVEVIEEQGPSLLIDDAVLISGEVERTTPFEKGFPIHYARRNGTWERDPLIADDQNLIVNVKDQGLVVVSGCSHSGAVNVLKNAQRLTGESRIAGFIGGLHLSGAAFEPIIGPTIEALTAMSVGRIVPAHCSGWKAVHTIARSLPDAYVQPAVGTVLRFGGA